ncbi:mobilization relaxase, partial [Vibrio parahaemolyticus]|nr:mobilization relaxase [Vibrio parahaemolyticus]
QQLGANVRHYFERERHVTPASQQLERAGQHLEQSTPAVGKALQHEKSLGRHVKGMGFSR